MIEGVALGVGTNVVGNRIDSDLFDKKGLSEAMLEALVKLDKLQRERLMFMVNIGPGTNWQTHVRVRTSHILFSVDGASANRHFALQVSTSNEFDWFTGTIGGLKLINLPILLDNGKAIKVVDLVTPAAVDYSAYLLGYTE